jgi:hypothetical protein
MAVTFNDNPTKYTPSDNPIIWRFSSDETAQPNFVFVVEVYIGGLLYSTHKRFVERSNFATFNGMEIAKNVCAFHNPNQAVTVQENSIWTTMYIKVIEMYGTTPTLEDDATSTTIYPFKASLSPEEFDLYRTQANQYIVGGVARRFNTFLSRLLNLEIRLNDHYWDGMITDDTENIRIKKILYDADGVQVATAEVNVRFNITLVNFNSSVWIANTSLTSQNYIDSNYYEYFFIRSTDNTRMSEIRRVYLNKECGYFGRQVYWVNKFGSFDNFLFFHNQQAETEITKQSYTKQYGGWVGDNYVLDASVSGKNDFVKDMSDKVKITSEWMTMEVFNWLNRSLLESPYVMVQKNGGIPYRILPQNATYSEAQDRFEELFGLTIECELPNMRKSQTI